MPFETYGNKISTVLSFLLLIVEAIYPIFIAIILFKNQKNLEDK